MADKQGFFEQVTNRTAIITGFLLGISAFSTATFGLFDNLRGKWEVLKDLPPWTGWGLAALLALVAIYLFKAGFAGKSRLLRPERFLIRPDEPRFLKGREREIEELERLACREPLIFLDGESGSGKSALVRAGLIPWCDNGTAPLLPIRVDLSGAPWDNGISEILARTLWREREKLCKEIGLNEYPQDDQVFDALQAIKSKTARLPLLIFDQFDDYQTAYREKFYPEGGSRLVKTEEFLAKNRFWQHVRAGVGKNFHCLVITRSDTRAGLDAIRFCDAQSYSLQRVENSLIEPLLDEITAPGKDNSLVVDQPELGWQQLRERLLVDLGGQERRILPIQLTVALDAIRRWRFLTATQYRAEGGLPGLERLHVQGHAQDAARSAGLQAEALLKILLMLTDSEGKKTLRCTFDILAKEFSGVPSESIQRALGQLEKDHVLRRVADSGNTNGESWLLYHDYLARGVIEAHRMSDRWRIMLGQRSMAWKSTDGWRNKWQLLLSVATQVRIVWEVLRGRLDVKPFRSYLAWSSLRFALVLAPLAGVVALYEGYRIIEGQQVARSSIDAMDDREDVSPNEASKFKILISRPWRVKRAALQYSLEDTERSKRGHKNLKMLVHAVVGLDKTRERSNTVVKMYRAMLLARSEEDPLFLGSGMVGEIRIFNADTLALEFSSLLKTNTSPFARSSLADAIGVVGGKLEPKNAEALAKDLVELFKKEADPNARSSLVRAIGVVGGKLEPKSAEDVAKNLFEFLKKESNLYARSILASAIGAVGGKLEPKNAEAVAKNLVELLKKETDSLPRSSLADAIGAVGGKLEPKNAEAVAKDLFELAASQESVTQLSLAGLKKLEGAIGSQDEDSGSRLQRYVDLLKGYFGGIAEARSSILEILEVITGQKFDGDKWRFVDWASSPAAAKYRLNLD